MDWIFRPFAVAYEIVYPTTQETYLDLVNVERNRGDMVRGLRETDICVREQYGTSGGRLMMTAR